jgi:hypothetical protein
MLDALQITRLHDDATLRWHRNGPSANRPSADEARVLIADAAVHATAHAHSSTDLEELVLALHRANYDLWHEEDKARDPDATNTDIASFKRAIDTTNQARNDLMEALDKLLLAAAGQQNQTAPLHSESPGLILDRLSILALKLYHTAEESRRASASGEHRQRNIERLQLLEEQREDLYEAALRLMQEGKFEKAHTAFNRCLPPAPRPRRAHPHVHQRLPPADLRQENQVPLRRGAIRLRHLPAQRRQLRRRAHPLKKIIAENEPPTTPSTASPSSPA